MKGLRVLFSFLAAGLFVLASGEVLCCIAADYSEGALKSPGFQIDQYDFGRTSYYPFHTKVPIPKDQPFTLRWEYESELGLTARSGDVDGDGVVDLVVGDSGWIRIFDGSGTQTNSFFTGQSLGILADWEGDGRLEILTWGQIGSTGQIAVWDCEGATKAVFQTDITPQARGGTAVVPEGILDVDGDGAPELIASKHAGYALQPRGIVVFDCNSRRELWYYSVGPDPWRIACIDLGGRPGREILFSALGPCNNSVGADGTIDMKPYTWCLEGADGTLLWRNEYQGSCFVDTALGVCDLEGDGTIEVVATSFSHGWHPWDGPLGQVCLLDPLSGTVSAQRDFGTAAALAAIGDLDGDGVAEIIVHVKNGAEEVSSVAALDTKLQTVGSFDLPGSVFDWRNWTVTDLDGDGTLEVLAEGVDVATKLASLYVLDSELDLLWRIDPDPPVGYFSFFVSDLDGDEILEIVLVAGTKVSVYQGASPPVRNKVNVFVGDANADRAIDVADAVATLSYLFGGAPEPPCLAALDTNADHSVNIADSIQILSYLFGGGVLFGPDGVPLQSVEIGCMPWDQHSVTLPCEIPCD